MSEPGYWTLNDAEAEGLRTYLAKGGFLIFDDFRQEHWYNFEAQMRKVLPDQRLIPLDASHPVFHAFFEIDPARFISPYGGLTPTFHGIFEDNDPTRRLQVDRQLRQRPGRVLGILGHRLGADRPVQRGLQVRRELHRVRYDALDRGSGLGARVPGLVDEPRAADDQRREDFVEQSSQRAGGPERTRRHRARRSDEPRAGCASARSCASSSSARTTVLTQVLLTLFVGGNSLIVGVPGLAKTLLIHTLARVVDLQLLAHPVHPRPDAVGHHRHRHHPGGHHHRPAPDDLRAGADLHQHPARRRDQPHPAEDAVGAARGDAGAPRHHPGPHLHARGAVLRLRHAEPDRARGHLSRCPRPSSTASCSTSSSSTRPRKKSSRWCAPPPRSSSRSSSAR